MSTSLDDLAKRIESTYEEFQSLVQRMEQHESARTSMNRGSEEVRKQARATRELTSELMTILGNLKEAVGVLSRSDPERSVQLIQEVQSDVAGVRKEAQSQATAIRSYSRETASSIAGARQSLLDQQQHLVRLIEGVRTDIAGLRKEAQSQTTAVTRYKEETALSIEDARERVVDQQHQVGKRVTVLLSVTAIILVLEAVFLYLR